MPLEYKARADSAAPFVHAQDVEGAQVSVFALPAAGTALQLVRQAIPDAPFLFAIDAEGRQMPVIAMHPDSPGAGGGGGGDAGTNGWSPVIALVSNGESSTLMRVASWTGGTGTPPQAGLYIGANGLTSDISMAVNVQGSRGQDGPPGLQGPAGDQGETGPKGDTGATGLAGDPGAAAWTPIFAIEEPSPSVSVFKIADWAGGGGAKPAIGKYIGPTGLVDSVVQATNIKGEQGPEGQRGLRGEAGEVGQKGDTGNPGAKGSDGLAATVQIGTVTSLPAGDSATVTNTGTPNAAVLSFGIPRGATGDRGETGLQGQQGTQGTPGEKGETGATGAKGDTGDAGPKGDAGKSAYEVWLAAGNSGTETQYLASLKGAKGDTGDRGPAGEDGTELPVFTRSDAGKVPAPGRATTNRYLNEAGSWAVPANTTYSALTIAELISGTATTSRVVTAKVLTDWLTPLMEAKFNKPIGGDAAYWLTGTGDPSTTTFNATVQEAIRDPNVKLIWAAADEADGELFQSLSYPLPRIVGRLNYEAKHLRALRATSSVGTAKAGTMCFGILARSTTLAYGATVTLTETLTLTPSDAGGASRSTGDAFSAGTWRCLGFHAGGAEGARVPTLWIRTA